MLQFTKDSNIEKMVMPLYWQYLKDHKQMLQTASFTTGVRDSKARLIVHVSYSPRNIINNIDVEVDLQPSLSRSQIKDLLETFGGEAITYEVDPNGDSLSAAALLSSIRLSYGHYQGKAMVKVKEKDVMALSAMSGALNILEIGHSVGCDSIAIYNTKISGVSMEMQMALHYYSRRNGINAALESHENRHIYSPSVRIFEPMYSNYTSVSFGSNGTKSIIEIEDYLKDNYHVDLTKMVLDVMPNSELANPDQAYPVDKKRLWFRSD